MVDNGRTINLPKVLEKMLIRQIKKTSKQLTESEKRDSLGDISSQIKDYRRIVYKLAGIGESFEIPESYEEFFIAYTEPFYNREEPYISIFEKIENNELLSVEESEIMLKHCYDCVEKLPDEKIKEYAENKFTFRFSPNTYHLHRTKKLCVDEINRVFAVLHEFESYENAREIAHKYIQELERFNNSFASKYIPNYHDEDLINVFYPSFEKTKEFFTKITESRYNYLRKYVFKEMLSLSRNNEREPSEEETVAVAKKYGLYYNEHDVDSFEPWDCQKLYQKWKDLDMLPPHLTGYEDFSNQYEEYYNNPEVYSEYLSQLHKSERWWDYTLKYKELIRDTDKNCIQIFDSEQFKELLVQAERKYIIDLLTDINHEYRPANSDMNTKLKIKLKWKQKTVKKFSKKSQNKH